MITGIQKMISFNILKDKEYTLLSWLRIIKKSKKDLTKINISCIDNYLVIYFEILQIQLIFIKIH